jgi:hypothetical protein
LAGSMVYDREADKALADASRGHEISLSR